MSDANQINFDDLPEFLRPRLRLFLSVDMVGSTILKQSGSFPLREPPENASIESLGPKWFPPMSDFYRGIEHEFFLSWKEYRDEIAKKCNWNSGPEPELWKINGDELIYTKELNQVEEAYACVSQWMVATKTYRKRLRRNYPNLDLKCTAWLAGFPVGNIEVIFRTDTKNHDVDIEYEPHLLTHYEFLNLWYEDSSSRLNLIKDYIGPSIDTGFRLTGLATPQKLVVSVDLALLLSSVSLPQPNPLIEELVFHFDGNKELKGVLKNKPYPVFWIDMHKENKLVEAENQLRSISPHKSDDIINFCSAFIDEHRDLVIRPFIVDCIHLQFQNPPPNFHDHLMSLNNTWLKERATRQIEKQAVSDKEPSMDSSTIIKDLKKTEEDKVLKSLDKSTRHRNNS